MDTDAMTPSRLSSLRDLWPHLSDIERELLQEVERLQEQPPSLKLHASCLTIEAALRTALDAVNRELEQAKEYLGRLLLAHYPQIELLDSLLGVCTQIDNGLAVALREAKEHLPKEQA